MTFRCHLLLHFLLAGRQIFWPLSLWWLKIKLYSRCACRDREWDIQTAIMTWPIALYQATKGQEGSVRAADRGLCSPRRHYESITRRVEWPQRLGAESGPPNHQFGRWDWHGNWHYPEWKGGFRDPNMPNSPHIAQIAPQLTLWWAMVTPPNPILRRAEKVLFSSTTEPPTTQPLFGEDSLVCIRIHEASFIYLSTERMSLKIAILTDWSSLSPSDLEQIKSLCGFQWFINLQCLLRWLWALIQAGIGNLTAPVADCKRSTQGSVNGKLGQSAVEGLTQGLSNGVHRSGVKLSARVILPYLP